MVTKFLLALAGIALAASPTAALADSMGYNLRLRVGVNCTVQHQLADYGSLVGGVISLGQFREYCNAPRGYELVVSYTPGTLRGTTIIAGDDRVVLDGSGKAVLSRATGPRSVERKIAVIPGENGFNTERLDFGIMPS